MALQVSTGFTKMLLGGTSFAHIFANAELRVYSGTQPVDATKAETGTLLGKVSPVNFVLSGPYVIKDFFTTWVLAVTTSGTPGWCRLCLPTDFGSASYDLPRVDGDISGNLMSAAVMKMTDTNLLSGIEYVIDAFTYTFPPVFGA